MKKVHVRLDDRNRVSLTKVTKKLPSSFYAYESEGRIILEPIIEVSEDEAWLFKPENKDLLAHLRQGLSERATISRGSFSKFFKKKK